MATRRKIGVNAATSEAARRQLMAQVSHWELVLDGSIGFRVYRWVKTDKIQQFSDDEGDEDEPLAPLPDDEPEVAEVEGDGDDEDDLALPGSLRGSLQAPSVTSQEPSEAAGLPKENETEDISKPPSPKPHPLSISFRPSPESDSGVILDQSLSIEGGVDGNVADVDVTTLDMSVLGPDGTAFEDNLAQLGGDDTLMGMMMDQTADPLRTVSSSSMCPSPLL